MQLSVDCLDAIGTVDYRDAIRVRAVAQDARSQSSVDCLDAIIRGLSGCNWDRGPEKAIQDIDNMVACYMADRNLPKDCWDVVGEHCTLVNARTSPCPTDKSITIYEAETGEALDLDAIPELGCFAIRHLSKLDKKDFKLSPRIKLVVL